MNFIDLNSEHLISVYKNGEKSETFDYYHKKGVEFLKKHKWGLVILGGGQGTRLGSDKPKGLFVVEGKPIFEWHMLKIQENIKKWGSQIKVFIMTSTYTHVAIDEYFKSKNFGVDVVVFQQEEDFCIDFENKKLPYFQSYATAPNGNGNFFKSINTVDISDLYGLNAISVDNVLATPLDPVFVGCFCDNDYDILSKSVTKRRDESMGTFFIDNEGKIKVAEYSESQCPKDGLQGNICNHLFKKDFVVYMKDKELPIHLAKKKIPYTENGVLINPKTPNGFKKETFIFDSFVYTNKSGILNVLRDEEFSPLKNKTEDGPDNPETFGLAIRRQILKLGN